MHVNRIPWCRRCLFATAKLIATVIVYYIYIYRCQPVVVRVLEGCLPRGAERPESGSGSRENVTVAAAVNAVGVAMMSSLISEGETIRLKWMGSLSVTQGWALLLRFFASI